MCTCSSPFIVMDAGCVVPLHGSSRCGCAKVQLVRVCSLHFAALDVFFPHATLFGSHLVSPNPFAPILFFFFACFHLDPLSDLVRLHRLHPLSPYPHWPSPFCSQRTHTIPSQFFPLYSASFPEPPVIAHSHPRCFRHASMTHAFARRRRRGSVEQDTKYAHTLVLQPTQ